MSYLSAAGGPLDLPRLAVSASRVTPSLNCIINLLHMNKNRNKNRFTVIVIIIVAIGLMGPGMLIIFSPQDQGQPENYAPVVSTSSQDNAPFNQSTSSEPGLVD